MTQQVFVALLENRGRLLKAWDPTRGMSFENYVGLIAEQQAAATLRKKSSHLRLEHLMEGEALDGTVDSSRTPERIVASSEVITLVHKRVYEQLSDLGRQLFRMLFIEGRPIEEVCIEMNMSDSAAYAWRSRLGRLVNAAAEDVLADPQEATKR
jgi:RNA polymerase sigma-70 factor (ECF subfamily)